MVIIKIEISHKKINIISKTRTKNSSRKKKDRNDHTKVSDMKSWHGRKSTWFQLFSITNLKCQLSLWEETCATISSKSNNYTNIKTIKTNWDLYIKILNNNRSYIEILIKEIKIVWIKKTTKLSSLILKWTMTENEKRKYGKITTHSTKTES